MNTFTDALKPGTLYEHVDSEDACIRFCRMYGEFCKKYYNEKYPDEAVGDKLMLSFQTIIMVSSLIFSFVSGSETSLPVYIRFCLAQLMSRHIVAIHEYNQTKKNQTVLSVLPC